MEVLKELLYSKDHEWVKIDSGKAWIGITDFAQEELGSIVYVEGPKVGDNLSAGDELGVVESVKAASDIYSPVSGRVIEVNAVLEEKPELINEDPYGSWIAVLNIDNDISIGDLMNADEYEKYCDSL